MPVGGATCHPGTADVWNRWADRTGLTTARGSIAIPLYAHLTGVTIMLVSLASNRKRPVETNDPATLAWRHVARHSRRGFASDVTRGDIR